MVDPKKNAPAPARPVGIPASGSKPAAAPTPAAPAAPKKDKAAAFQKLAVRRTNKALKFIQGIAALSNRNAYSFTTEQVEKIFAALNKEVSEARAKFEVSAVSKDSAGFTL